ncbi:DNA-3-methyladenine glycosylase I [Allohahella sp. A8]|uniref:DNA-3-methyladenine glycosylase I n=1 Tax=Allohahella sp. A8 TaxID=3141461 RepID=UPI003A810DE0
MTTEAYARTHQSSTSTSEVVRCSWCGSDPLYQAYHDYHWGRPEASSQRLFAKLCLDGQQAGLSWITILRKQAGYEAAFYDFDPLRIAGMSEADVDRLMQNPAIVRNRLKIKSVIKNARAFLELEQKQGPFNQFLWQYVNGRPIQNHWRSMTEVPATTPLSDQLAKDLKKLGFSFVGSTIVYAFMQATGLVNDHLLACIAREACEAEGAAFALE